MTLRKGLSAFKFLLLAAVISAGACRHAYRTESLTGSAPAELDVPFFPSRSYDCGSAALAGVLQYWGVGVAQDQIKKDVLSDSAKGTLTADMVWYMHKHGLKTRKWSAAPREILSYLHAGIPVIILVDYGIGPVRQGHYMVVTGYSDQHFRVHTGTKHDHRISVKKLVKRWKRTHYWALAAAPEQRQLRRSDEPAAESSR